MRRLAPFALALLAASPLAAQTDGAAVYAKYCSQCHGEQGDGKGIAARFLKPAPRDFTAGKFKVRTTPNGSLPTDDDLRHVIRVGLPYSSMPAFPNLSDADVDAVVAHIKTFSADFEDPEAHQPPIDLPAPPTYNAEAAAKGREVYAATGCGRCHGEVGRGDGMSAPTLRDDWGRHIRVADLTMPWTFRGGGTRRDIFRTMSTGFNGTPMPGFNGSLPVEDIWSIVDYITSIASSDPADPYSNLVRSVGTQEPFDLERADELFAAAPPAMFPLVGQIMQPGRDFHPPVLAVIVQAVHNTKEIAFRVRWHDMRAETTGSNAPDLSAPKWDDELAATGQGAAEPAAGEGEGGGFWGAQEESAPSSGSVWGDDAVEDGAGSEASGGGGGDVWGDVAESDGAGDAGGGDFWGEEDSAAPQAAAKTLDTEFSDAVALQFPLNRPEGVRLPYFILGDSQNPVQLWYADLAHPEQAKLYVGRGSAELAPAEDDPPEMVARYDHGEWSVVFKRPRRSPNSLSFDEGTFVPIAASVWDGFNRDRGNRRALTTWYYLYLEPLERPSTIGPMVKAGVGVLAIELLLIGLVRWRSRKRPAA